METQFPLEDSTKVCRVLLASPVGAGSFSLFDALVGGPDSILPLVVRWGDSLLTWVLGGLIRYVIKASIQNAQSCAR